MFAPFMVYRKAKVVDADIYVLHDPELLLIALLLQRRNKCVIWDCHEYYDRQLLPNGSPLLRTMLLIAFKTIRYFVIPRLDGIVAISSHLVETFDKLRARKICLLRNFALLKEFSIIQMPDFKHAKHILYTGTIQPNFTHLIYALSLCKNSVRLILCARSTSEDECRFLFKIPGFSKVDFRKNICIEEIRLLAGKCFAGMVVYPPN